MRTFERRGGRLRKAARVACLCAFATALVSTAAEAQASSCRYTYRIVEALPGTAILDSAGGTKTWRVDTEVVEGNATTCPWNVASDDPWITFGHTGSFTGSGQVTFRVSANRDASSSSRSGTIRMLFGDGLSGSYTVIQAAALGCGQVKSGTFPAGGGVHAYDFQGTAGEAVTFTRIVPSLQVYGPDGAAVRTTFEDTALPLTGTYTVVLTASSASQYSLGFQFTKGGSCAVPIACGQTLTGALASVAERDAFRFSGIAGERVALAKNGGPPTELELKLWNPSGQLVEPVQDGATSYHRTYALPSSGAYTVTTGAQGESSLGLYDISLQFLSGRCAATLSCGQVLTSTATEKRHDAVRFEGVAGRFAGLFVPAAWQSGTGWSRVVDVFDPNAMPLPSIDGDNGDPSYKLPTTGTYTAIIFNRKDGEDPRVGLTCEGVCASFVHPLAASFGPDGGRDSTFVKTGIPFPPGRFPSDGCCWTAQSNVPWIRVFASGGSACSSGSPAYEVDPFTGSGTRTGTITVAGQLYTVTQSGTAVAPGNLAAEVVGTRVTLTWTAPALGTPGYVLEAGTAPGLANLASISIGSETSFVASSVPAGTYYIRVRAATAAGLSGPSNEVVAVVAGTGSGPPGPPEQLASEVIGNTVTLTWLPPGSGGTPTTYVLEAGTASGLSNLAVFSTGSTQTTYVATGVALGIYFVRVFAANALGTSAASNEVRVTVAGACSSAPPAPGGLLAIEGPSSVTLTWTTPPGSGTPINHLVEAGSAPGLADRGVLNTGSSAPTTAVDVRNTPRGVYYLRVRALNPCGTGPPSADVGLTLR